MKKKILLVDDEETLRWALKDTLLDDGYDVEDTNDSVEALKLAKKIKYDLVISDLTMPIMNGVQLIAEIKKVSPATKAVIMTGYGSTEAVIEAMHTGVSDFITKPFKLDHIKKVIRKVLNERNVSDINADSEKKSGKEDVWLCEELQGKQTESWYVAEDETETSKRVFYDIVETGERNVALFGSFPREAGGKNLDIVIKTIFRYEAKTCISSSLLVKKINNFLCENVKKRFPLMLFCVISDKNEQKFSYSVCGEDITCFITSQDNETICLQSYPPCLNMFPDMDVPEHTLSMREGNRFIVIDNGAVAKGFRKGIIQKDRLKDILEKDVAGSCETVAKKMKHEIEGLYELAAYERNGAVMVLNLRNRGYPSWKEEMSISLPVNNYDEIVNLFEEKLSKTVKDECKRYEIITSVNEATLNALLFAYKGEEKGKVVLRFSRLGEDIIIEISDRGCGFDPRNCEEPDTTLYKGITKKDGRGIFIMKHLMDRVMIQSHTGGGTSVFLAKRVSFNGN